MFTWINKQGVKSSKGFSVQRTSRFTAEYTENEKKITIDVESGILPNGKYCLIIGSDAFVKWDDGSIIKPERQKEILNNFKEAIEFQDMGVVID
ncbi:MAG: hypothetical protein ACYC0J_09715 [Gammaproteobacteria bacterium]